MAGNPRRANGSRRNRVRAYWKALEQPCAVCGGAIDYSLHYLDDMAFEVDEIVPVRDGGDPFSIANTQPVHRRCNRLKYQRERQARAGEMERRSFRPLRSSGEF